jgi:hypothetical protein
MTTIIDPELPGLDRGRAARDTPDILAATPPRSARAGPSRP